MKNKLKISSFVSTRNFIGELIQHENFSRLNRDYIINSDFVLPAAKYHFYLRKTTTWKGRNVKGLSLIWAAL